MRIIGIDPGLSGAIAILEDNKIKELDKDNKPVRIINLKLLNLYFKSIANRTDKVNPSPELSLKKPSGLIRLYDSL